MSVGKMFFGQETWNVHRRCLSPYVAARAFSNKDNLIKHFSNKPDVTIFMSLPFQKTAASS